MRSRVLADGSIGFDSNYMSPTSDYSTPNGTLIAADLDGDGRKDIFHAVANTNYVHTWMSNGDGTFRLGTFTPWAGYCMSCGSWLAADLNGDGRTDLVHTVGGNANYIHTWLSNGDGTFNVGWYSPPFDYNVSNGIWLAADVNGDRRTDLVHVVGGNYVHPWISNGDGTFTVLKYSPSPDYVTAPGTWLTGDLDGDGRIDLIHTVGGFANYIHPWISNGDGTFAVKKYSPSSDYLVANGVWVAGDINGDGRTDLVHVVGGNYVHPWISNGDGTFWIGRFSPSADYNTSPGTWLTGDLDGDGRIDLVHTVGGTADYLHTWRSNGDGSFTVGLYRPWSGYKMSPGAWLSLDVDGDGRADLLHTYPIAPAHGLTVNRHLAVTFDDAAADRALTSATRLLYRNDGAGDVVCSLRLFRDGGVGAFGVGNGVINNQAELDAVFAQGGRVKVVNQINFCGGALSPNIIGCGQTGGSSPTQIVVPLDDETLSGVVWAHEYGHTRGLNHTAADTTSVMSPTVGTTNTWVTAAQCFFFGL